MATSTCAVATATAAIRAIKAIGAEQRASRRLRPAAQPSAEGFFTLCGATPPARAAQALT
jgi:hypothetical protein